MNLTNFNLKSAFIVFFIIIFIFLLILVIPLSRKGDKEIAPTNAPTPTTLIPQISQKIKAEPTLIPIKDNTGVKEELFPSITQTLINQKQTLRNLIPLVDKDFRLDFDYGKDKFTVTINSPKDSTRKIFDIWLQKNYPAIPIDRFIIN